MSLELELKHLDERGNFSGYASIFGVVDNQNDRMLEGAFTNTLHEGAEQIKLLWQHNFDEPIGTFSVVREDSRGLYVEGKLLLDVQRAKEAYALLKAGAIAGLSIGYVPVRYTIEPETGVRALEEVTLYEISLVTFPANTHAQIARVKERDMEVEAKGDWSGVIRNGDFIRLADEIDRAMQILRQI